MASTSTTKQRGDASEGENPLERLAGRLKRARRLTETGGASSEDVPEAKTTKEQNPLGELEARIREASDPAQWAELLVERAGGAPEPLAGLLNSIQRARLDSGEVSELSSVDLAGAEDPIEALRGAIADEIDDLGARFEPLANRDITRNSNPATGDSDAAVADELLSALAAEPLSGEARAEAARRLAAIAENPTSEQVREVLRLIVHNGSR